jgi:uncharacterized protein YutE (UPF0331/DUF86 family)
VTDAELVGGKLAEIETYLRELRSLARPTELAGDVRERRFVEHTLQVAIQAALDVASHVISDERLGEPRSNRELFEILAANGWIDASLASRLRDMAGFRNVLVHGYTRVNVDVVRDVLARRLGDLDAFIAAVRTRLQR